MSRSLREEIKRRVRRWAAVAVAGWVLIALGESVARYLPNGVPAPVVPVIGVMLFFGALIAARRVRCPKCRAAVGRTIAMPVALSWGSGPKVNLRPFCDVSLDEPCPDAPDPLNAQNPIKS